MQERKQTQQKNTSNDSFVGFMIPAFMGAVCGVDVGHAFEAADVTSAFYTDRYKLGQKKSLSDDFARQSIAEKEHETFRPSLKPSMNFGMALAA